MERVAVVSMDIHKRFTKAVVFGEDGSILGEARIVHDHRLLHNSHVLDIKGRSYRLRGLERLASQPA